jgi:hypothetical protein
MIGAPDLFGHEILVDRAMANEVGIDGRDQIRMLGRRDAAIIRERAGFPELLDALGRRGNVDDLRVAGEMLERLLIDGRERPRQARYRRCGLQALSQ